jgi:hypothetical protein
MEHNAEEGVPPAQQEQQGQPAAGAEVTPDEELDQALQAGLDMRQLFHVPEDDAVAGGQEQPDQVEPGGDAADPGEVFGGVVWHSGYVAAKGELSAEIRGVRHLAGAAVLCLPNVIGLAEFAELVQDFRVRVVLGESPELGVIVTQLQIVGDQVREELARIPIALWSVEQTARWVGVLGMEEPIAATVQASIIDDQIDGEQLVALKVNLLRSVLCQVGRLSAEHESEAAAAGFGAGVVTRIPQMIIDERDMMQQEQLRQHAGGALPLGARLSCDEDRTHEFKDYSMSGITRAVGAVKGISRYVTAFLNSGEGGSLLFGVTDDGYVRGVRLERAHRDDLRLNIDAALRPSEITGPHIPQPGMIVGPQPRCELNSGRWPHYRLDFIPVTGRGAAPLCNPAGDPVVYVVEIKVMPAMGNNGWHRDQETPAPKWCVKPDPMSEQCYFFIKQSASVSRHRIDTLAAAREISRNGYNGQLEEDSDEPDPEPDVVVATAAPTTPVLAGGGGQGWGGGRGRACRFGANCTRADCWFEHP